MSILSSGTLRIVAIVAAVLVILYGIAGFLIAPGIVKSKAVEILSETTGRPVTLEDVSVNPFALSVTLRGFSIPDRDGERVLAFRELYVNYEVISLLTGAQTFSEIKVVDPYIRALVRGDGSMNFEDLMPPDRAREAPPDSSEEPLIVVIYYLIIENGDLEYEDRHRTTPFGTSLDSLSLSLKDFTTKPNEEGLYEFTASTAKGEGIAWKGDVMFHPMRSSGSLALTGLKAGTIWEFMRDQVYWKITAGTFDVSSDYVADLSREPGILQLKNGSGTVRGLTMEDTRDMSEAVVLPEASASGLTVDANARTVRIGKLAAAGGRVRAAYWPDSTLSIQTLFMPRTDPLVNPGTAKSEAPKPWAIVLDELSISDFTVPFADRRIDPPAEFEVVPLDVSIKNFCYGVPGTATLKVDASISGQGRVSVAGPFTPEPTSATFTVNVDTLPLPVFQPYVAASADMVVKSGTVTVKGSLKYSTKGEASKSEFAGDVRIQNFRAVDTFTELDFVRLPTLDVRRVKYTSDPAWLSIKTIAGKGVYARFIIDSLGITNAQRILRRLPDTTQAEGEQDEKKPDAASAAPQTSVRIDEVTIADGTMDFSDLGLIPRFVAGIHHLNGTIRGLSSEQLARANVDLEGKVDRYAPAFIKGQINPLSEEAFTDLTLKFTGIELTTFTPYSGKFMGYKIDKGKMNLDLHYRLNNQYLKGDNQIVLDQFTLGQKVTGASVTDLPVKLAIALLKDSEGVIDLDIPVEGDLNDPEFSLFPIILKIFLNLILKIITAPFALIGALFGGGEELSFVTFEAGVDSLAVSEQAKLDSLAHALKERPGLTLNIRGVAGTPDRELLARRQVLEQIRGAGGSMDTVLTGRDRERLFALYKQQFGEDAMAVGAGQGVGGEESQSDRTEAAASAALKRMVDHAKVPDESMRQLAQKRSAHIKDHIVQRGGIEDSRLFLQDVSLSAPADGTRVRLELGLDAK